MKEEFDFLTLLIVLCISIGCCAPGNHGIERRLDKITQEIHILNDNLHKIINKETVLEENNDN